MKRFSIHTVALTASLFLVAPAFAQGFTVVNRNGGTVEQSRSVSAGEINRSVERTTTNDRTMSRDIKLERTAPGEATRTVTRTGPNGHVATHSAKISR